MGRLFTVSLEGKIYYCKYCGTHIALHEDFVSKSSNFNHGEEAYLFNKVVNVTRGELTDRARRIMRLNSVAVIFCVGCGITMGWTCEFPCEIGQKYREGKWVLERLKLWFQSPDGGSSSRVGGNDADDA